MLLIIQDNWLINCQILVNWLHLSFTLLAPAANVNNHQPAPANLKLALVGILGDDDMTKQREIILAHDLPGDFQQVGTEATIILLAQAVTNGNQKVHKYQVQQEEAKQKEKLPSQRCNATIVILLHNLNIADEVDLPVLWHQ